MKNTFRRVHLFSHNDLDGYSCNVVVKTLLGNLSGRIIEHNCSYADIGQTILKSIRSKTEIDPEKDLVVVSDISWRKDETDITDFMKSLPKGHIIVADHHLTSEWIADEIKTNTVVTVEGSRCGCVILQDAILSTMDSDTVDAIGTKTIKNLRKYTELVNDWDLWNWADKMNISDPSVGQMMNMKSPKLACWFEWFVSLGKPGKFTDSITKHLVEDCSGGNATIESCLREEYDDPVFIEYMHNCVVVIESCSRSYCRFKVPMRYNPSTGMRDLDALLFTLPKNFQHKSFFSMVCDRKVRKAGISDYDCIVIWVDGDENISLRYPTKGLNLAESLSACIWHAGGHRNQAGAIPGKPYMDRFIESNTMWNL